MGTLNNLKLKVSEKELNAIETLEDRIKELEGVIKAIKETCLHNEDDKYYVVPDEILKGGK